MTEYYKIEIAGLTRNLPICKVDDKLSIAAFNMFNDVELTIVCARELLVKAPEFDILFTAEAKSIPLIYEMARQANKPYIVARKGTKLYMNNPQLFTVRSITTAREQQLVMDSDDLSFMSDKRIYIVDDVISTGGSLYAMEQIVETAKAKTVCKGAVLAEGEAQERDDLVYLAPLPLIFK